MLLIKVGQGTDTANECNMNDQFSQKKLEKTCLTNWKHYSHNYLFEGLT